jgi:YD repeat-containing protein
MTYWNGLIKTRTVASHPVDLDDPDRTTIFVYYGEDPENDPAVLYGLLKHVNGPRTDIVGGDDTVDYDYAQVTDNNHTTGDLVEIRNALGQSTFIDKHDKNGRPLEIRDPNGSVTVLSYHPRGWLSSRTVDGKTTSFLYDKVGQLTRVTLADGSYLDYTYDDAHRLTDITDALGNGIHYTLDAMGHRVAEETRDAAGDLARQIERVYNDANRLEKRIAVIDEARGERATTGFTYGANGELWRTIDPRDPGLDPVAPLPDPPSIYREHTHDALNRLTGQVPHTTDGSGGAGTTFAYDVFDHVTRVVDPRGLETRYGYNGFGELRRRVSPDTGAVDYVYDEAGNRKRLTYRQVPGVDIVVRYTHDALGRLTRIDYTDDELDTTYTYDEPAGGPGAAGRLTTLTDQSGVTAFTYTREGRLASVRHTARDGTLTHTVAYGYDAAGRVESLAYPSGLEAVYSRDAGGRVERVETVIDGVPHTLADPIVHAPFGGVEGLVLGNGLVELRLYDGGGRLTWLVSSSPAMPQYAHLYDAAGNLSDRKGDVANNF